MCLAAILQMQLNNVLLHSQASHWALRFIGPCVNVVGGNLALDVKAKLPLDVGGNLPHAVILVAAVLRLSGSSRRSIFLHRLWRRCF